MSDWCPQCAKEAYCTCDSVTPWDVYAPAAMGNLISATIVILPPTILMNENRI
jgi:hypothetical protein